MTTNRHGNAPETVNGSIKSYEPPVVAKTDHTRWRLKNIRGVQTWHYLDNEEELKEWPMSTADKYYLGLDTVGPSITIPCRIVVSCVFYAI